MRKISRKCDGMQSVRLVQGGGRPVACFWEDVRKCKGSLGTECKGCLGTRDDRSEGYHRGRKRPFGGTPIVTYWGMNKSKRRIMGRI